MTAESLHRLRRAEQTTLVVGLVGVLVAAILGWFSPRAIGPAWRLAVFACLQPALGSLIFILIHRLTGGQWARGLAPFLLSGTRLLPWVWLLVLPLLFWPIAGQPVDRPVGAELRAALSSTGESRVSPQSTTDPGPPGSRPLPRAEHVDAALQHTFAKSSRDMSRPLRIYFSRAALSVRAICYAAVFFLLALGAPRAMRATTTLRWFGPLGLIGLVFILHFLATDWIVMLDPGWYSTGFPLVWITAQAIAGIALAIGAAVAFGAEPAERGEAGHVRGIDWGNLMLAAIMVWTYVAFVQLLIIWSGNLPAETAWYRHRALGFWRWLSLVVAVVEFGAPFFLLLSRALKRRRRGLFAVAALLLLGQVGYTLWLIGPAFPSTTGHAPWLIAAMLVAALGLFANRYFAGARSAASDLLPS
jgi:hypothetical protein